MSGVRVRNRWRKGPHDRLYLETPSGLRLGWYDLRSGRESYTHPGMGTQCRAAVSRWKAENPGWSTAPPSRRAAQPSVQEDLAVRRAGEGLARKAAQLQLRNPVLRLLGRVLGVRTRDHAWRVGAAGEKAVGKKLDKLARAGWRVLHGVELGGGGDIDHLVIGKFGVFVVNTKHHRGGRVKVGRGGVTVGRHEQAYVGKAHVEADRVRRALVAELGRPVHVAPIVVVHGHRKLSGWIRRQPYGVQFVPSWVVRWWFRLPGRTNLSPGEIDALYETARQSATWSSA